MEERITANCRRALQRAPTGRTTNKAKTRRFLEHLAATCNVMASARAAGINTTLVYAMRKRDPAFAAAWKEAMEDGYVRLEEELLARALGEVTATRFDAGAVDLVLVDGDRPPAADDGGGELDSDGGGARPAGRRRPRVGAGIGRAVALVDVQLALALLNRRQAAERRGRARNGRPRATAAEVEAAINAKLDTLAARLAEQQR